MNLMSIFFALPGPGGNDVHQYLTPLSLLSSRQNPTPDRFPQLPVFFFLFLRYFAFSIKYKITDPYFQYIT
jgi:hypothetical protein